MALSVVNDDMNSMSSFVCTLTMSVDRSAKRHWRQSLTTRVMLITGGLVVGTALVLSALAIYLLNAQVEQSVRAQLDLAHGTAELLVQQRVDESLQWARWLAADPTVLAAARAHDTAALNDLVSRFASTAPSSQVLLVDGAGTHLVSSFDFDWDDEALFVTTAVRGRARSGISASRDCRLFGVAAIPLGDERAGAVVVSTPLTQAFVDTLQVRTQSSAWLMCGTSDNATVLGAHALEIDAALSEMVFTRAEPFVGISRVDGVVQFGYYFPLNNSTGKVIGMIGLSQPLQNLAAARENAARMFIGVAFVFAVLVLSEAYWLARGMTRPLRALTHATQAMAEGNLNTPLNVSGSDEFAVLAQTFAAMRAKLSETYAALEKERNRYRDFLAIMPHEFKTPLAALAASLELLEMDEDALSPDQHALLNSLHRSVIRLKNLVNNLLDTASIQAGQFHVRAEPYPLSSIIAEACEFTQPLLAQKNQPLQLRLAPDLPLVMADPRRVTQVLINLISNAHKYGPAGAPLSLEAAACDGCVRVAVTDYGAGIPQADQGGLFQRYIRAHQTSTSDASASGMGFGLAIVREIIEQHGGTVGLESRVAEGTTVWFTLPTASADEPLAEPERVSLASEGTQVHR